jgi:ABC-2 type transport system ATP-binding protein
MSTTIVEFHDVWKKFGQIEALRGITFSVQAGEVFSFIGPNGSGKTTTIRTLLGFYRPHQGSVLVFGRDPLKDFSRIGPSVGVMLEQPGLYDHLTAAQYLEFYAGLFGIPPAQFAGRGRELLRLVGLEDRSGHLLGTFSKGMRQRISLARCLINRARLLVLDEPFDGIDVETRRHILDLLPSLARNDGASVFVTSHNLPEVEQISDRIAVVSKGRVVGLDRPETLRRQLDKKNTLVIKLGAALNNGDIKTILPQSTYDPSRLELRVDLGGSELTRDQVLKRLIDRGISVASMNEEISTLEDVYFALTQRERNNHDHSGNCDHS